MKKIYLLLIGLILFTNIGSVQALSNSKYATNQPVKNILSEGVTEEIIIHDAGRMIDYVEAIYTISEDYEGDIKIVSGIFDALSEAYGYLPGDSIKVKIKVVNNSKHEYNYVDKSFILATEDLEGYNLELVEGTYGFNNKPIYEPFAPHRTANKAIQELYGVASASKVTSAMVSDEALDAKLKEIGYQGVEELNLYYLDFYNEYYKTDVEKLEDFDAKVISAIFNGNCLFVKESNVEIVELGYNYWYNKLFAMAFEGEEVNDQNMQDYAIGSYMRNKDLGNNYFKEAFTNLKSTETKELTNAYLKINGLYTTNAYMNYNFSAYLEFSLDMKEEEKPVIDEGEIVPPNTGIN